MKAFTEALLTAPADRVLFPGERDITAGQIRATAAALVPRMAGEGPLFLHTASAALFAAALLAAAVARKALVLPAHTQASYLAEVGGLNAVLLDDASMVLSTETDATLGEAAPDVALTFFTSGSTGVPKRIERRLAQLETEARALEDVFGAEAGAVQATVSHQHIYGLIYRIVWPVMAGRPSADRAAEYWENLEGRLGAGVTLISSPAHLTRLPPAMDLAAQSPGLIFSSGQLLQTPAALICTAAFGRPVTEVLGSTETGGVAWRRQSAGDEPWRPFSVVTVAPDAEGALTVLTPYLDDGAPFAMGDRMELLADGRFRLLGRADRMEKVDGKRVSLTRVEEALAALPHAVEASALILPDRKGALAAVVALSPAGQAALDADGAFRLGRHLRAALADRLEPIERPKHWRFVDRLPTDAQGKRRLSDLRALFDAPRLPPYEVVSRADDVVLLRMTLPPTLAWFQGHFPGEPILPGISQVHMAVLLSREVLGWAPEGVDLNRVKFKDIIRPGETLDLTLTADRDKGRLSFRWLRANGGEASSGSVG
ncbi:AMP-binding protein [Caulobacter sp. NIBR1757]|uniref:ApeI family dehydratase n=1 Tax=Caulobacter sp. NIBR1757 TaxID=3016000 RepID=UPI0022F09C4A|nr:AMP-binding protein [Caulobacter sp. NIBR1757]WGM40560.1 Acetyl-coenzyme A synthetase [Caulobacter sp. NIBR1757]